MQAISLTIVNQSIQIPLMYIFVLPGSVCNLCVHRMSKQRCRCNDSVWLKRYALWWLEFLERVLTHTASIKSTAIKGTGRYWEVLKIIVSIKNLLGNDQWRAVESIKHSEKRLPLELRSFWERSNVSLKYLNWIPHLSWGLEFKHLKTHNFVVFSSIVLSQLQRPIELGIWTGLFLICWVTQSEKTCLWQLPVSFSPDHHEALFSRHVYRLIMR